MKRMTSLMLALAILLSAIGTALAADPYTDGATADWFRSLSSPYTHNCCDQADCMRTLAEFRADGFWWAVSNKTHKWTRISPSQITSTVSIFKDAVLCEGSPSYQGDANVFCFAPPPISF